VRDKNVALPEIVELYGGVRTIGLHVADLSSSLVSSDENPFNELCFSESSLDLPACISQRVLYKSMNATSMVQSGALEQADIVIVDPPRKGLDETGLMSLCTKSRP
jgi:tRNA/tmRNA/rRNA uracil-C5-methylase (TrmA/RlmC/RlmD family)